MRSLAVLCLALFSLIQAGTIRWSGYTWEVKSGEEVPPGPNNFSPDNVWVDDDGMLHLEITKKHGDYYCAEVSTRKRFGFGTYQFKVIGRIDTLDADVVLGMFSFHHSRGEIDIEVSGWGGEDEHTGQFAVFPPGGGAHSRRRFPLSLEGSYTTHRYTWGPEDIYFQVLGGHREDEANTIKKARYRPEDAKRYLPSRPMPVHINLWLYAGAPHQRDFSCAEVIIKDFTFVPLFE